MGTGYLVLLISDGKEECELEDLTEEERHVIRGLAEILIEEIDNYKEEEEEE